MLQSGTSSQSALLAFGILTGTAAFSASPFFPGDPALDDLHNTSSLVSSPAEPLDAATHQKQAVSQSRAYPGLARFTLPHRINSPSDSPIKANVAPGIEDPFTQYVPTPVAEIAQTILVANTEQEVVAENAEFVTTGANESASPQLANQVNLNSS